MTIDLRQLRHVLTLAQTLHFGRAADALHIAQPALTKIIQQLEAEVGVPLLLRGWTGMVLGLGPRQVACADKLRSGREIY